VRLARSAAARTQRALRARAAAAHALAGARDMLTWLLRQGGRRWGET
jgi:hypothetical protein